MRRIDPHDTHTNRHTPNCCLPFPPTPRRPYPPSCPTQHAACLFVIFPPLCNPSSTLSLSALADHSPNTRGWQSPRFCEYPQEVGIQFIDGVVQLTQVQLLSHQSKISTRIELYMGVGPEYMKCTFTRLGYLSLDSNERSAYKARELKSVYLKAKGVFMKLLLHKCHVNTLNLHNQVGLVAINMLGIPVASAQQRLPQGGAGAASLIPRPGLPMGAAAAGASQRCAGPKLRCPCRLKPPPSLPFFSRSRLSLSHTHTHTHTHTANARTGLQLPPPHTTPSLPPSTSFSGLARA